MRPLRATIAILGLAFAFAAVACLLPDIPYQRWQLLDGTIQARARWIYERVHFDATPVDVVFLGPSRVGAAVDAPRLERALAAQGVSARVVNFSLPEEGENINNVIAQELYKSKRPKLVVVGVIEKPSRFGHPTYKFLASRSALLFPGYWDLNYLSDLSYLPYRELDLFAAMAAPSMLGMSTTFDPRRYLGASVDTTGSAVQPDGRWRNGDIPAPRGELERQAQAFARGSHASLLPTAFADAEFGDERYNIRQIAGLARARGSHVAFLYLPYYSGPSTIQEAELYRQYGPIWDAGFLASHAEWYSDYAHLTRTGANHLTDWLATPVRQILQPDHAVQ